MPGGGKSVSLALANNYDEIQGFPLDCSVVGALLDDLEMGNSVNVNTSGLTTMRVLANQI